MANLISHKDWMSRTYLLTRPRSKLLLAVDQQLQFYEKHPGHPTFLAIKENLKAWMDSKKPSGSWVRDARNAKGAVTELWDQLHAGVGATDEEQAALDLIAQAKTDFLLKLFSGTKLQSHNFVETASNTALIAKGLKSSVDKLNDIDAAEKAQKLGGQAFTGVLYENAWSRIADAFQGADFADVLRMPEFMAEMSNAIGMSLDELGTGMVAGAGLVKSTVKTIWSTYKVAKSGLDAYTLKAGVTAINTGDPMAAFVAVQELVDRELAKNALILASHAAETGAKAGGMFADLGAGTTAIAGLSGTIARLLINISYMARDWKERYYANKLLANPEKLDANIFRECPVLGCYYMCCADTSMIIAFLLPDLVGKKSFKDVIENAVRNQLEPTLKIANHALYRHRFRLGGKSLPKMTVLTSATNKTGDISYMKASGEITLRGKDAFDRLGARVNNLKNLRGNNTKIY